MDKSFRFSLFFVLVIVLMSVVSAFSLGDFWNKFTGKAIDSTPCPAGNIRCGDNICRAECSGYPCTDGDGGKKYDVRGTTTGYWSTSDLVLRTATDVCVADSPYGSDSAHTKLYEYSCVNNYFYSETHNCTGGTCKNGACVIAAVTPTTPTTPTQNNPPTQIPDAQSTTNCNACDPAKGRVQCLGDQQFTCFDSNNDGCTERLNEHAANCVAQGSKTIPSLKSSGESCQSCTNFDGSARVCGTDYCGVKTSGCNDAPLVDNQICDDESGQIETTYTVSDFPLNANDWQSGNLCLDANPNNCWLKVASASAGSEGLSVTIPYAPGLSYFGYWTKKDSIHVMPGKIYQISFSAKFSGVYPYYLPTVRMRYNGPKVEGEKSIDNPKVKVNHENEYSLYFSVPVEDDIFLTFDVYSVYNSVYPTVNRQGTATLTGIKFYEYEQNGKSVFGCPQTPSSFVQTMANPTRDWGDYSMDLDGIVSDSARGDIRASYLSNGVKSESINEPLGSGAILWSPKAKSQGGQVYNCGESECYGYNLKAGELYKFIYTVSSENDQNIGKFRMRVNHKLNSDNGDQSKDKYSEWMSDLSSVMQSTSDAPNDASPNRNGKNYELYLEPREDGQYSIAFDFIDPNQTQGGTDLTLKNVVLQEFNENAPIDAQCGTIEQSSDGNLVKYTDLNNNPVFILNGGRDGMMVIRKENGQTNILLNDIDPQLSAANGEVEYSTLSLINGWKGNIISADADAIYDKLNENDIGMSPITGFVSKLAEGTK